MSIKTASSIVAALVLSYALQSSANAELNKSVIEQGEYSVTTEEAITAAQAHLVRLHKQHEFQLGEATPIANQDSNLLLCYRFALEPRGYVVVSASTLLPPIMAYSFTSTQQEDHCKTDPLRDLLTLDLSMRLENAELISSEALQQRRVRWNEYLDGDSSTGVRDADFEQWPPAGSTTTGGWVETNWNQSPPHNNLCPTDGVGGSRSLAGCPAVAMAQILNFHARINGTTFDDSDDYYHNYGGNRYWIDDDSDLYGFPSFTELNVHLGDVFGRYHKGLRLDTTCQAALVFACGVAARQVYSAGGSGTFGVSQAMEAYQEFGCSTAELLEADNPLLFTRLAHNMQDAFPAHLAIVNEGWTSGHNVVLDGYNSDDYYHVNFGWGGAYDGWYLIPSELPYSLTVIEGLIVDIMTDECGPMDCTCDGIVGWNDFALLPACIGGPGMPTAFPGCTSFDADEDGDVDLEDLCTFQTEFTGQD